MHAPVRRSRAANPPLPADTVRMKHGRTGVLIAPWLIVLAPIATAGAPGSCGAEEPVLRKIKLEQWPSYYRGQDAEGLASFLLEGFQVIGADGSASPRAEELAWVAANPWRTQDFLYTITSITCPREDVAIIVGEGRFTVTEGVVVTEHRYTSSNVLVKRDGRWRAALSHLSGEKSKPLT